MHLSSNAASTTFTFLFMLFVFCPVLCYYWHYLRKKARREDQSLFLNGMCGKLEYLVSWHSFWDEIVPEVYSLCNERYDRPISIYDVEFEEVGYEIYGCEPAVEALNRALAYMKSIGRPHYINYSENERWFHHYRRPDLAYKKFCVTKIVYNQTFPEIQEPENNDRRRTHCLCSDDKTEIKLKEMHQPYKRRCY